MGTWRVCARAVVAAAAAALVVAAAGAAGAATRTSGPAPRTDQGAAAVWQWSTGDELFTAGPDGSAHHLTRAEWDAAGDPAPQVRADQGFEKLTWAPQVAQMTSTSRGSGATISHAAWTAAGSPTPRALPRLPGDRFYAYAGEATVYYAGPTMNRAVTYAEWSAAGRPTPTAPPAGAPARTVRTTTTPVGARGGLAAGFTATSAGSGTCPSPSEAGSALGGGSAAHRCFAGDAVLDPCWRAAPSTTSVLCLPDPWSRRASRVRLTAPLSRAALAGSGALDAPWGLALADGRRCTAVQGAHDLDGARAVDYTCTGGAVVLDGLDEGRPQWRADVAPTTDGGYGPPAAVAVTTAWYPAASA